MEEKAFDGVRRFREGIFPKYAGLFRELAEGHHPPVLFITCCDSRIDPCLIAQTRTGDMMVVHSAGNVVRAGRLAKENWSVPLGRPAGAAPSTRRFWHPLWGVLVC